MQLKSFPHTYQNDMMECGTTCLSIIFQFYGYYDVRNFLTQYAGVDTEGIDLFTLSEIAEDFGFETDGYKLEYENLSKVKLPCIAHYEGNHFVVVYKVNTRKVWISDPSSGKYSLSKEEFMSKWNGIILELRPNAEVFQHNEITDLVKEWRKNRKKIWKAYYKASMIGSSKYVKWIIGSTILLLVLSLSLPFFTQTIIDNVIANRNIKLLYAILLGMGVVFVLQTVLTYIRNLLMSQFKIEYERNFFSKFFKHTILLSQSYYDRHKREDFINRFNEHLKIRDFFSPVLIEEIIELFFVPVYITILFIFSQTLGWIVLTCVAVILISLRLFTPKLMQLESLAFDEKSKTIGKFLDVISGIQTVKLLRIERFAFFKWKNAYTRSLNKVLDTEHLQIKLNTFSTAITLVCQATVFWYGAYLAFEGQISLGVYVAFITIFSMVMSSILDLRQIWLMFSELSVSINKINDIFSEPIVSNNHKGKLLPKGSASLTVSDLTFFYTSRQENPAIDNVSISIDQGQYIGIVGRNGSGKSTLAKLLAGLYDHYDGSIKIDDVDIRELSNGSLKKAIVLIPQEVHLFDGSVRENILYARPGASEKELVQAVNLAGLAGFVRSNFLGLNLMIGDGGSNLSGGQKLKIAFARLFLMDPKIIVLDEASSALDAESEQLIMKNIRKRYPKATIISIAHRLNTLKTCDNIYVIDNGSLIESGNHDSLKNGGGLYQKFIQTYVDY